jgi:hypothetical protein
MTRYAAAGNFTLLQRHDFHLNHVIAAHPGSPASFGSEFCPVSLLKFVLFEHPLLPKVKGLLTEGVASPLDPISKEERDQYNAFMMERGNHKSSYLQSSAFHQLITDKVRRSFQLPIPLDAWHHFPKETIASSGMFTQGSIYEFGQIMFKDRATFDQSFPGLSGKLVNKRFDTASLTPCKLGFCIKHIIHYIVFYAIFLHPVESNPRWQVRLEDGV